MDWTAVGSCLLRKLFLASGVGRQHAAFSLLSHLLLFFFFFSFHLSTYSEKICQDLLPENPQTPILQGSNDTLSARVLIACGP